MKKLAMYAPPRGPVAVNPKAFGLEFLVAGPAVNEKPYLEEGPYAVVRIEGPLSHKPHWCWDSYEDILTRARAAFESGKDVVLRIDSPGGDVAGCFEAARELRKMAAASGRALIAYADGMACSAAYALACAASRIIASPTSMVGSVGVIEAMVDATAQDAAMGLRFAFATSGKRKGDGNPHIPLSKEALAAMQSQVDGLADVFFTLVEELRGIPAADVAALEAGIFFGEAAMATKLADVIMTWPELVSGAANESEKPMAKLSDAVAALMKAAEGEDDDAKKARKMLKAYLAEEKEPEKEEPKEEGKAEAAPEKKEEAKAESEPEKKDSSAKMKAAASAGGANEVVALARELHALKAERAAERDAATRREILSKRPDLSPEALKALASVPTEALESVVATFPKLPSPAAALAVTGTRGATQGAGGESAVDAETATRIDIKMGLIRPEAFVGAKDNELHLGLLTPEEARKRLSEKTNGGK